MAVIRSFRDLDVYRVAREQAKVLFETTRRFPKEETYSLTDQVRRSSRAVNARVARDDCRGLGSTALRRRLRQQGQRVSWRGDGNTSLAGPRARLPLYPFGNACRARWPLALRGRHAQPHDRPRRHLLQTW